MAPGHRGEKSRQLQIEREEVMHMKHLRVLGPLLLVVISLSRLGCSSELTPEQKQLAVNLKQDLGRIRQEIGDATKDDAAYSSGLIKSLIGVRLEVLKTNEALVEQRIHAIEAGTPITLVVNAAKPDPTRAAQLAEEIESQKRKVTGARAEADRYSGGLVQAMAETTVATARNTLAMLEQQYFIAKYGLAIPPAPTEISAAAESRSKPTLSSQTVPVSEGPRRKGPKDCLKIETFDSSVLSTNDVFTELAWKVDVSNSCAQAFNVRVTFTIYDKDEFELDSDFEDIYVPAPGTGKARGKMLVSPPEKAQRLARQGASLSMPSLAYSEEPKHEDTLQAKVDSLKIGISDLDTIEKLFGKPENLRKGVEWHQSSTHTKRTIYQAEYPSRGLSFSLFANPSELYSITTTTKDISIRGLRIGDTLESVRIEIGEEGLWRTSDAQDWWWLEFEKHGLRIGFDRQKGQKKYPISLAKPELATRIQLYNSKVSFYNKNKVSFH